MTRSKWVIEENANRIVRASTIKPRIDFATKTVDEILEVLAQKKLIFDSTSVALYKNYDGQKESSKVLEKQVRQELEISYSIESIRQVRRCLDPIAGLGSVAIVLSSTIAIVRTIRSKLFLLVPELDFQLGELSLLLGGIIIDAAHLAGTSLDFGRANEESRRLLDEAKLIADSKIYKRFPNLDFL